MTHRATGWKPVLREDIRLIATRQSPVTTRSVTLGLLGVLFICGLSPYNDFVVGNTFVVGHFLPVGLLLFFMMVVLLINAPLLRWFPNRALSSGELVVAMAMSLIVCGLPGSGLMRYLPPQLVGVWQHGKDNPDFARMLSELNLPDWMFPAYASTDPVARGFDPITQNYFDRVPNADSSFAGRFAAVPWRAWLSPAIAWSAFSACLIGAMVFLMLIVRRQWVDNERLSFPLATIYLSIIEPPEAGKSFNTMLRSRSFWLAFGVVFTIHLFNSMREYFPAVVPEIPLRFDLNDVFTEEPWRYLEGPAKRAKLFFTIVGICYFLPSQISLSIWFFYALLQVSLMSIATLQTGEYAWAMRADQFLGAAVPYAAVLLWIGRRHWAAVARQMFRGHRAGEPAGRYLPYAAAGWGLLACITGGAAFLYLAGASLVGAVAAIGIILTLHLIVARIVAETGMPFIGFPAQPIHRLWLYPLDVAGARTTMNSYFLTQMVGNIYATDVRETPTAFISHTFRLCDETYTDAPSRHAWKRALPLMICLVVALVVGFYVSGVGKLYTEYSHAVTLDQAQRAPLDDYGTLGNVRDHTLGRSLNYRPPNDGPIENFSRVGHFTFGAVVSITLSVLRLNYATFPFHPVGFLLCGSWPVSQIWFSLFIGWLAKAMIVRFGGTTLYRSARWLFLGLILGEAGAGAFWLVTSLLLNAMDVPYKSINLFTT